MRTPPPNPAHQLLDRALLNAAAGGQPIPCAGPWVGDSPWLSDVVELRNWAITQCADCPVITECRNAGKSEQFGVWGGVDTTGLTIHQKAIAFKTVSRETRGGSPKLTEEAL